MDETLLKGIEVSIEVNRRLAKEYLRRSYEYEKAGNEQLRSYWFVNYHYLRGLVESLGEHKEQLLKEES